MRNRPPNPGLDVSLKFGILLRLANSHISPSLKRNEIARMASYSTAEAEAAIARLTRYIRRKMNPQ